MWATIISYLTDENGGVFSEVISLSHINRVKIGRAQPDMCASLPRRVIDPMRRVTFSKEFLFFFEAPGHIPKGICIHAPMRRVAYGPGTR